MKSLEYIAGFFDGEGSVYLNKKQGLWRISISQAHEGIIKDIKKSLGYGNIHKRKKGGTGHLGKKQMWEYYIQHQMEIMDFIEKILLFTTVKKEKLQKALNFIKNREWHYNYKLKDVTKEQLEEMYSRMSMDKIAKHFGVVYNSIHTKMVVFDIPRRSRSEAAKRRCR